MIKIINCDLFEADVDIICHQVNCQGVMGSGVAKQVREKYPKAYEWYIELCRNKIAEELLGASQTVRIGDKYIINLFAQCKYGYDGNQYTDLNALKSSLESARDSILNKIQSTNKRIAFPYLMSCARGGADWKVVEGMIIDIFEDCDVTICRRNKD